MNITLMLVSSLDGKITQGAKPGAEWWASPEDQTLFRAQIATHDLLVMGSATYEAAKAIIRPDPAILRIVMTRTPEKYASRPGLAFSDASPETIVRQAEKAGHTSLLLVGGAVTAGRFLNAGFVDELLITIEPYLFGTGTPLVTGLRRTTKLKLIECQQLNSQGTLLAQYHIER
jgi:dihydrofolate reductase